MSKNSVFVIRNHDKRYLTKKHEWRSGDDRNALFRNAEKDIALNELIEVNAKDVLARLELVWVELDDREQPAVEVLADDPPEALESGMTADALVALAGQGDAAPSPATPGNAG